MWKPIEAMCRRRDVTTLGCFRPLHNCEDNRIHSAAGLRLRSFCNEIMEKQGRDELTGGAKITRAFNLPPKSFLHTVGPAVNSRLTQKHWVSSPFAVFQPAF